MENGGKWPEMNAEKLRERGEEEEVMRSQKQQGPRKLRQKNSDEVKKGIVKRRKIQLFSTKDFKRKCLFTNNDILHWIFFVASVK